MKGSWILLLGRLFQSAAGKSALLVIDVQDCFLEADTTNGEPGSLQVPASHIIPLINSMRQQKSCLFDEVIFSQDYHPEGHISFASVHGVDAFSHLAGKGGLPLTCLLPANGATADAACCPTSILKNLDCETALCPTENFTYDQTMIGSYGCDQCLYFPENCYETTQSMWPDHCLETGDSGFPPKLDKRVGDLVVKKGTNKYVDAYSAFMDNSRRVKTELDAELQQRKITKLYIVGIASDVCVLETVLDALSDLTAKYEVVIVNDATAPVLGDYANHYAALDKMVKAGATNKTTEDILAMDCPPMTDSGALLPTIPSLAVGAVLTAVFLAYP